MSERPQRPNSSFERDLAAVTAEERARLASHPSVDELTAYHAGELDGGERERIAEHLALCPPCARELLDLADFLDDEPATVDEPAATAELTVAERERQWRALESRLSREAASAERPGQPLPFRGPAGRASETPSEAAPGRSDEFANARIRLLPLAAAIVVGFLVGMVFQQQWGGFDRPADGSDVLTVDMIPPDEVDRSSPTLPLGLDTYELPPEKKTATFMLTRPRGEGYESYRLELVGPNDAPIVEVTRSAEQETFNFSLNADRLVTGEHTIRYFGRTAAGDEVDLGERSFRIERVPGGP